MLIFSNDTFNALSQIRTSLIPLAANKYLRLICNFGWESFFWLTCLWWLWYLCQVKSSQVFYFPKQRHIYTSRYAFKTMSVGMAKQRSIAYRAACHGTKYKIQAMGINCRWNTEKAKGRQLDNPAVTGGTAGCHNDNPRCHQRWQSCQIDDRPPPEKQLTGSSM